MKRDITYPAEITFKSVYRNHEELHEIIITVLNDRGFTGDIAHRPSRNDKFVSYTITAEFESESHLDEICGLMAAIEGFVMMM